MLLIVINSYSLFFLIFSEIIDLKNESMFMIFISWKKFSRKKITKCGSRLREMAGTTITVTIVHDKTINSTPPTGKLRKPLDVMEFLKILKPAS